MGLTPNMPSVLSVLRVPNVRNVCSVTNMPRVRGVPDVLSVHGMLDLVP